MDIFSFFTLLGGLAFFLYGMNVMSGALERMAGGKLEKLLKQMTASPLRALSLGAGVTIAIQSSSALTVMLVGLVNSGIMQLKQTVYVIMGSNIGTTLTAWILAMTGIKSDNLFILMLKPKNFSPLFALVGIIMIMVGKEKKKNIGQILVGFSVLMYGMELMGAAVSPLADSPQFASLLTAFQNPLLGVLVGTVFTGIIQSSAASVGILQALALTGSISYGMAIPIIMGQNIGTCVTSLLSSIGVNKNAKRVAFIHISFNVIGTIIFLIGYYGLDAIFAFPFTDMAITPLYIAVYHSIFNVATTLMLSPFGYQLVRLAQIMVRDKTDKTESEQYSFLDERLLATPSFALSECGNQVSKMSLLAHETVLSALSLFDSYDEKTAEQVLANEDELDIFEDKIGTFLVKLSGSEISASDSAEISRQLHSISDFERIGDHAVNILEGAREMRDKAISFSPQARADLYILRGALEEILEMSISAYTEGDVQKEMQVEPLEQVIDELIEQIKFSHIERLKAGSCTIELGFILTDLLTNIERVSDHCSNIAAAVIESAHFSFGTHEYVNAVKSGNREFNERYAEYKYKYRLS